MHQLTFYPLGNADSYLIDLVGGEKILVDYADVRDPNNPWDKRIDLAATLRENLRAAKRDGFDVVAFTHADDDHVHGMSEFFHLEHAARYQSGDRVKIGELWVPAAVLVEEGLENDARVLQAEAQHRFRQGRGVRVFSRPDALKGWCTAQGIDWNARQHLITDAGQLVRGFTKHQQGVEFFVHSPFAERLPDGTLVDRNDCSLVLQATFLVDGAETRFILSADTTWENFIPMINITCWHGNEDRLAWDIIKLPHHCSYLSLSPEKGEDVTEPVDELAWLFEQGATNGIIVSTSEPIPASDTIQPPHRQAAAYYKGVVSTTGFQVTMEHPSRARPEPLVIRIDRLGPTVRKPSSGGATTAVSQRAPRAG
jgi:beta-lactamase superfamily II metal-dependent hydrolase